MLRVVLDFDSRRFGESLLSHQKLKMISILRTFLSPDEFSSLFFLLRLAKLCLFSYWFHFSSHLGRLLLSLSVSRVTSVRRQRFVLTMALL
jgi:hypothetical protein